MAYKNLKNIIHLYHPPKQIVEGIINLSLSNSNLVFDIYINPEKQTTHNLFYSNLL